MTFIPFLVIISSIIYIVIIAGLLLLIYIWVNKFIKLRQEQNDLLREIVNKLGEKDLADKS
jgi:hypothetical protein